VLDNIANYLPVGKRAATVKVAPLDSIPTPSQIFLAGLLHMSIHPHSALEGG
jgi:hypothetical protein